MALSNPFNPPPNTAIVKQDAVTDSIWRRWFEQLWNRVQTGGLGGTVTSVAVSGGTTGLTTSGGPITTSGTITFAGTLASVNGGTGLTSPGANGNVLTSNGSAWMSSPPTGGGSDLLIVYNNENLEIATNTQVLGFVNLVFTGTGNLNIDGTGQLRIL